MQSQKRRSTGATSVMRPQSRIARLLQPNNGKTGGTGNARSTVLFVNNGKERTNSTT